MNVRHRPYLFVLVVLFSCLPAPIARGASQKIAGIAFDKDDHVYVWHRDGVVTTGSPRFFEENSHARKVKAPAGETIGRIVATAISADNRVHVWYRDGKTSTGTATDLGKYEAPRSFTLPAGRTTSNIVGIAYTDSDQVIAWYDDATFSVGTATKLADLHPPAPYVLPAGKVASSIVEIDIAKSNGRVHAWYTDGWGSTGNIATPGSHQAAFGYVPAEVLYGWWGPVPLGSHLSHPFAGSSSFPSLAQEAADDDRPPGKARRAARDRDGEPPVPPVPQPDPGGDPSEEEGNPFSPAFASSFLPGFTKKDFHVAVGKKYVIVSSTGSIEFFDKTGQQLPNTTGMKTKLSTNEFFQGFVAKTNSDGTVNENNINLYMRLPKPCDSTDYPQLRSGNRFCIGSFYDTRVFYDSTSERFFLTSNSRHDVWNKDCVEDGPKCSCYAMKLSDVADPSICTENDGSTCSVSTDEYCGLARRYPVFAVSKTDDPRDGFHQYILTANIGRDWPAISVNGGHFVLAAQGHATEDIPLVTVFFMDAIKSGVKHPPFFRYSSKDVGGANRALPVTQYESKAGRTYLLANRETTLDIFAFGQQIDPWTAPPLQKASVDLGASMPTLFGSVWRKDRLYMVGTTEAESKGTGDNKISRYNIHLFRIPVVPISGTAIQASKDPAKGYLESHFGKRSIADPPNVKYSYEFPTISVNHDGHMLIGYTRRPYQSPTPLQPEARYSVWYAGEGKIRSSWLLKAGEGADPGGGFDYGTAFVDPDEKTFWVGLGYVDSQMIFRMAVGKITP